MIAFDNVEQREKSCAGVGFAKMQSASLSKPIREQ